MCVELLGTMMSHKANLLAATPCVVQVTDGIRDQIESKHQFGIRSVWAIGLEWEMDLIPFALRIDPPRIPLLVCVRILALDLLLANGDRTSLNPNLSWKSGELFVYDFEHCLEFRDGSPEDNMELHMALLDNFLESHVLGICATNSASLVLNQVDQLLGSDWLLELSSITELLPDAWRPYWYSLVEYLVCLRTNRTLVLERIKEVLQ